LDTEHRRIGSLYVRASNPTQPVLPR